MLDILVTGSRGFIGSELVRQLLSHPRVKRVIGVGRYGGDDIYKIKAFDSKYIELNVDITKEEQVVFLYTVFQPQAIFHLAGNPLTKLDEMNPTAITKTNILGTQNLLHYAKYKPRFVFASSAAVYGDTLKPAREDDPLNPTSVYGCTKVSSEVLTNVYTSMGRVNGISLRYVANVGRGATHGVLPDVIRKLRSNNPYLELFGNDPGTEKPYMHVEDTARNTIHFGFYSGSNKPINIAPVNSISIKKLAQTTMESINIQKPIKWLGSNSIWVGDNPIVKIDNEEFDKLRLVVLHKTSQEAIYAAAREL